MIIQSSLGAAFGRIVFSNPRIRPNQNSGQFLVRALVFLITQNHVCIFFSCKANIGHTEFKNICMLGLILKYNNLSSSLFERVTQSKFTLYIMSLCLENHASSTFFLIKKIVAY